jgi:hypothetical protein
MRTSTDLEGRRYGELLSRQTWCIILFPLQHLMVPAQDSGLSPADQQHWSIAGMLFRQHVKVEGSAIICR